MRARMKPSTGTVVKQGRLEEISKSENLIRELVSGKVVEIGARKFVGRQGVLIQDALPQGKTRKRLSRRAIEVALSQGRTAKD